MTGLRGRGGPHKNLVATLSRIIQGSLIAIGVGMALIVNYQIIARTGGFSVRWTEELARFLTIWGTFLAVPVLLEQRRLISIDFFHKLMPVAMHRFFSLVQLLAVVATSLTLVWIGWQQVVATWQQTSPGLLWPMGLFTLPVVISSLLSLIVLPNWGRDALAAGKRNDRPDPEKYL